MVNPIVVELVQFDELGNRINEGETGVVVSEHLVPVPDANSGTGMRFQAMLGVCWDNLRVPAISYHQPEELEWIEVVGIDDETEDDEDEDEEDDGAGYTATEATL